MLWDILYRGHLLIINKKIVRKCQNRINENDPNKQQRHDKTSNSIKNESDSYFVFKSIGFDHQNASHLMHDVISTFLLFYDFLENDTSKKYKNIFFVSFRAKSRNGFRFIAALVF
ncbi:hypothetical protein JYU34_004191 [Plutella xylostella]|uniref:Uncharacterized protein n=1 Tax=Plutella xylostella TaxID=51655 RepID=A0ABQ7QEM7_PLUXY|nr:hypothetical protein JYU34_012226 [Plutella xylostella]KAG7305665.1 hypothetical protein JYU34_009769 [Plutella xylostella]KAG7306150.1 hypothetical protein JYU34_008745 [Plutella xylostella]KAG7307284.1 hypothetical protein JYU34_007449 [Plutella xylostella]KAG7309698.1 hypothetical protein JYU34_004191 [Plutella xylostella]